MIHSLSRPQALAKLIPPGQRRRNKRPPGGVIQVWVTRRCNKYCYGCTQGANLKGPYYDITPAQFDTAVSTLTDYFGIVGVFGGNPCLHPQFEELCTILQHHIPQERCGLWANHLKGHGQACRQTFNPVYSNLNVHLDHSALEEIHNDWPEARPFGARVDSRHAPPLVAIQDLVPNEQLRWGYIVNCDINKHWSAMIGVFRGELRAWFCEIAGAQSILYQDNPSYPDTGLPVQLDWWRRPMTDFAHQADYHCHACGIPLRGGGSLAQAPTGIEQVTRTHFDICKPRDPNRPVQLVDDLNQIRPNNDPVTRYLQRGH